MTNRTFLFCARRWIPGISTPWKVLVGVLILGWIRAPAEHGQRCLLRLDPATSIDLRGGATLILDPAPIQEVAEVHFRVPPWAGGSQVVYFFDRGELLLALTLGRDLLTCTSGSTMATHPCPPVSANGRRVTLVFEMEKRRYQVFCDGVSLGEMPVKNPSAKMAGSPSTFTRVQFQPGSVLADVRLVERKKPKGAGQPEVTVHGDLALGRPWYFDTRCRLTATLPAGTSRCRLEWALRPPPVHPWRARFTAASAEKSGEVADLLVARHLELSGKTLVQEMEGDQVHELEMDWNWDGGEVIPRLGGHALDPVPFHRGPDGFKPGFLRHVVLHGAATFEHFAIYTTE